MTISGVFGFTNPSIIKDPVIEEKLPNIRTLAGTDPKAGMEEAREMAKYVLDQAYAIPHPSYRTLRFWWPWLKNYSGEVSVGYFNANNWTQYVWVDLATKKSMGY